MHEPAGATPRDVYRGLGDRKPKEISARLAELVALGLVRPSPGPTCPARAALPFTTVWLADHVSSYPARSVLPVGPVLPVRPVTPIQPVRPV